MRGLGEQTQETAAKEQKSEVSIGRGSVEGSGPAECWSEGHVFSKRTNSNGETLGKNQLQAPV